MWMMQRAGGDGGESGWGVVYLPGGGAGDVSGRVWGDHGGWVGVQSGYAGQCEGYEAAKAGVVAIAHALTRELVPHGIRVNCISPDHMGTELYLAASQRRANRRGISIDEIAAEELAAVPLRRFGTTKDVAGLVAFLALPDASHLTGQTINIDGGLQPR